MTADTLNADGTLALLFHEERETKGTYRFAEVVPGDPLAEPKVGTLYVRKSTLAALGWTPGSPLRVTLAA
jgi:hypothetical protein